MCCSQGALTGIGTILFGLPASNIVHYPELFVWVSQEPFAGKEMERSLPKRRFHVPKEVNDKKINETNSVPLTPLGSNEPHSPSISYLHLFECHPVPTLQQQPLGVHPYPLQEPALTTDVAFSDQRSRLSHSPRGP
ncbi:neuronal regeneration-related protein-like [Marmota monax]|uniref:neuronal regeneration-related protein-like n=1 Tax=Marmota monax TaxID=9995 RepID=UPI001EAFC149|nr:neuronal regeneration-related protein-like [Marmota monax]